MPAKIETANEAAAKISAMSPATIEKLIKGLRAQHPHLRHAPDKAVRDMLRGFVAANR